MSNSAEKSGEQQAFADFLTNRRGKEVKRQNVYKYFKSAKVNESVLREYAAFKGYPANDFLKWARGPVQSVPFGQKVYKSNPAPGMVEEPGASYIPSENVLKNELKKVYKENVELHQTIADRGNFILQLLGN